MSIKINTKLEEKGFNKIGCLPRDIEYNHSDTFKNFKTDKSGFGFSNLRVNEDVNKLQQNKSYIAPVIERNNPNNVYDFERSNNFLFRDHYDDYKMIDKKDKRPKNFLTIIRDFHEINPTMEAFFSEENLQHIQTLIKKIIKHSEKVDISDQSEEQILMVMRSVYMNATSLDCTLKGEQFHKQICFLNKDVINLVVPKIIVGIRAYLGYSKDISTNPYTVDRPKYINNAGLKNGQRGFSDNII